MKVVIQMLALLFCLALVAALGLGGYGAFTFIAGLLTGMDFQVGRITAIASVVVLLASVIIARAIRRSGRQEIATELVEGKAATYRQLIDLWCGLLRNGRGAEDRSRAQCCEELRGLEQSLALYGCARVLKAYAALRALEREGSSQSPDVRLQFTKTLLEIRKDFGSDTVGLTAGDLRELLFADVETVSTPANASDYPGRRLPVSLRSDS